VSKEQAHSLNVRPMALDGTAVQPSWQQGWWRLMDWRMGVIPVPVYLICLGVIAYFVLAVCQRTAADDGYRVHGEDVYCWPAPFTLCALT
jgi:hypothetical protein